MAPSASSRLNVSADTGPAVSSARRDPSRLSHAEAIRAKVALVWPGVQAAGRTLLQHSRAAEVYPEYLITFHGVVRASVPLMEAAVARARATPGDAVAEGLVSYLEGHIPEELGHDEWALEDLEVLGVDRRDVLARPPSPTVAAFVGAQYYWILHHHPVALLGYMTLLEAYPPVPDEIEELMARTGLDRAAFRTLLHHADIDPHHADELFAAMDALPLTPEQSALLGVSALSSARLLTEVILEVVSRFESPSV